LELNGTGKLNDPNYTEQWLQVGDLVELEVDALGILSNTIVAEVAVSDENVTGDEHVAGDEGTLLSLLDKKKLPALTHPPL
jgi:hypothetical protein